MSVVPLHHLHQVLISLPTAFSVTPSFQQHFLLPAMAAANAKRVFLLLLVRPDASKVPEHLRSLCSSVHLQPLSPMDVRAKLLTVCDRERVRGSTHQPPCQ